MQYKFILICFLIFPIINTGKNDLISLGQLNDQDLDFNFSGLNKHKKANSNAAVPFWETGKQKNVAADTASLKQSSWYAEVLKDIEESEYEIKYDEASKSYASPNRKNNLRALYRQHI